MLWLVIGPRVSNWLYNIYFLFYVHITVSFCTVIMPMIPMLMQQLPTLWQIRLLSMPILNSTRKRLTSLWINISFFLASILLQGHPESGKIWMKLIDRILIKDLGFKTTTKDWCIYIKKIKGRVILRLRQVDNFCTNCTDEQDAKGTCSLIRSKI